MPATKRGMGDSSSGGYVSSNETIQQRRPPCACPRGSNSSDPAPRLSGMPFAAGQFESSCR